MKRIILTLMVTAVFLGCGSGDTPEKSITPDESDMGAVRDTLNFGPLNKLDLNSASSEDLARIPGATSRMVHEFEEYRPYISIEQFRREMAKYIDAEAIATYEKYLYVPVQYNDSDKSTILQIPGVNEAMADSLLAGRPYDSGEAFLGRVTEVAGGIAEQFARHYLTNE